MGVLVDHRNERENIMSWVEDGTEVLAEGVTPEGKRMQIIAEPVEYSGDMMPDDDGYVPTMYMGYSRGSLGLNSSLNLIYFPVDEDCTMNAIQEMRYRFRDNWDKMAERWLRIMGAKDARVREVALDRSSWGIVVSAHGQEWQNVTGVCDDYKIRSTDTEEYENWLKGEVSWVSARVSSHDCNCEYCGVEWIEMDDVPSMSVCAAPWDIQHDLDGKYAYVLADMIAESGMIQ